MTLWLFDHPAAMLTLVGLSVIGLVAGVVALVAIVFRLDDARVAVAELELAEVTRLSDRRRP